MTEGMTNLLVIDSLITAITLLGVVYCFFIYRRIRKKQENKKTEKDNEFEE